MKKQTLLSLFLERLTYVVISNTLISIFLYLTVSHIVHNLFFSFVFSQSIGLSSYLSAWGLIILCKNPRSDWGWTQGIAGTIIGTMSGTVIGFLLVGDVQKIDEFLYSEHFYLIVGIGIWYGLIVTYYFLSQDKIFCVQKALHQKQIHLLESEKQLIESRLNILQEQIEPHFLFNTLSNILSLVKMNPQRGHTMLERFIDYLRSSLNATRGQTITLGGEVEIVAAYLDVIQFRMGNRLQFDIDIPEELSQIKIPPMLIQPFVENSIKHGLEPKVEGGSIRLTAEEDNASIKIIIADTGLGIQNNNGYIGIGLSNTSERLALFSNKKAEIQIEKNQPEGTRVIITLPINQTYD